MRPPGRLAPGPEPLMRVTRHGNPTIPLTVDDLIAMLNDLRRAGYGSTPVMRCDYEAGPCFISELFSQNDPAAHDRGETPAPTIILIG